ncbi:hypothetical protein IMAU60211_00886 [Lactobacillus helveticus]|nr:hypothetical protein [Lactobacillus helveticus]NRO32787.1 hypothetical protein [Lactobacillus helveticus]NRO40880.1 hypothetical protein [Lactobacillus helveticus]NRO56937.1 hypothetical protein [Lactobacillus helveticus]
MGNFNRVVALLYPEDWGLGMQTVASVPYEIVSIVIAAIIFFIAIKYVFDLLFKVKKTTTEQHPLKKGEEIGPDNGVDGPNLKLQKKDNLHEF